jgi:4-aminobutyrate aminotransferase-like enzyme
MARGLFCPVGSMQPIMFIEIVPPLTINEDQLRDGLEIIDEVLDYTDTLTDD